MHTYEFAVLLARTLYLAYLFPCFELETTEYAALDHCKKISALAVSTSLYLLMIALCMFHLDQHDIFDRKQENET
jgi:hypothetical protein